MQNYFECNLPKTAPYWMHPSVMGAFNDSIQRIYKRMDTLNEALEVSGLDGATFAKHARILFDMMKDKEGKFDSLTPEDIAEYACLLYDGVPVEPRMEWPNAMTVVDTAFVTTKEWESIRHFGIGGSDAAVIAGTSHFNTPFELYHDKCGTPEKRPNNASQSVFDRGHIMEPRVIEAFCKLTGAEVIPETRMFASKKHPNSTANIDAIVRFSDGRMYVFEAKTTIADNWQAWSRDKIPAYYIPQMRQYPAVLDDDRILGTYIGCLFTRDTNIAGYYVASDYDEKDFVCRFLDRDPAEEETQLAAQEQWFKEYIEQNEEPEESDPKKQLKAIHRMTGAPNPKAPPLEWDLAPYADDIEQYMRYSEEMSALEKRKTALEEARRTLSVRMVQDLGNNTVANIMLDDNELYEIKNGPRSKTTVDIDSLTMLIDAASPFLPDEMKEKMLDCIVKQEDAYRVFSIAKKKAKKKK